MCKFMSSLLFIRFYIILCFAHFTQYSALHIFIFCIVLIWCLSCFWFILCSVYHCQTPGTQDPHQSHNPLCSAATLYIFSLSFCLFLAYSDWWNRSFKTIVMSWLTSCVHRLTSSQPWQWGTNTTDKPSIISYIMASFTFLELLFCQLIILVQTEFWWHFNPRKSWISLAGVCF